MIFVRAFNFWNAPEMWLKAMEVTDFFVRKMVKNKTLWVFLSRLCYWAVSQSKTVEKMIHPLFQI